jgi:ribosome recycling factor
MTNILEELESNIESVLEFLRLSLSKINTGKVQSNIFDLVKIECYGTTMSLSHIAIINVVGVNKVSIQPHDKSLTKIIDTQIRNSDLNVTSHINGDFINVFFPLMTAEHRDSLVKMVSQYGEKAKIMLREYRRTALSAANELIGEDDRISINKKTELLVSKAVSSIENLVDNKNKNLKQLI